jgi:tetratricopeptide (TPR) repeat protein
MAQGNLAAATQTYRELVKKHHEVAEARHNLAVALARQGQQAEAISEFREALRIRPDMHAARIDLATVLLEAKRPQAVVDTLQAITSGEPVESKGASDEVNLEDVYYRLGIAFLMLEQMDKAIGQFERTLQEQPNHAGAHLYLGRLYFEKGRYDAAWRHGSVITVTPFGELILNAELP